jgi:hypothetical protein
VVTTICEIIFDIFHATAGPDDVAFAVLFDVIGAAADIIGFDCGNDLTERKSVGDEPCRIRLHLKLLDEAADGVGAGDARYRFHLRADDPILYGTEVDGTLEVVRQPFAFGRQIRAVGLPTGLAVAHRGSHPRLRIFDGPPVDLAEAG